MYQSVKKYGHNVGFSCCFRQWQADSHCAQLHGYSLAFKFIFESEELDKNGWVLDFGGLKPVKAFLEHWFDHTTLVAESDPHLEWFQNAGGKAIINLREMPRVGCEAVARFVHGWVATWLINEGHGPRVWLRSVEVAEHEGNSAVYELENKKPY